MASVATKALTANLPLSLIEQIDLAATRLGCSSDWIVEQALNTWLSKEDMRWRLTWEALFDVDDGNVVDHQTVQTLVSNFSRGHNPPNPRR